VKTILMAASADELFERHALAVYRYFRRMTGRPDVAEDLTQDVFLRVVRSIDGYQLRNREVSWVFRIARNVLVDHWQKTNPAEVAVADIEEPAAEETQILALGFHEALRLLATGDRDVYLLRERGGLTYQEIAQACETTEEAVRSKLYRARRQIKRLLSTRLSAGGPDAR
jgi:RNA polymerase sigma-70 factor (ECF subfamily)